MLMPMMYKMGVMMTMLIVLTAISVKGLLVGKWKKEKKSILSTERKKITMTTRIAKFYTRIININSLSSYLIASVWTRTRHYRCHVINAETEHANSQVLLRLAAQCAGSSTDPCARSQQSTNVSQSSVQRLDTGERFRRGTPLLLQSVNSLSVQETVSSIYI